MRERLLHKPDKLSLSLTPQNSTTKERISGSCPLAFTRTSNMHTIMTFNPDPCISFMHITPSVSSYMCVRSSTATVIWAEDMETNWHLENMLCKTIYFSECILFSSTVIPSTCTTYFTHKNKAAKRRRANTSACTARQSKHFNLDSSPPPSATYTLFS